jgi:hypothetical protein
MARLERWLGILGLPTGPFTGLGLLLGLFGFALTINCGNKALIVRMMPCTPVFAGALHGAWLRRLTDGNDDR